MIHDGKLTPAGKFVTIGVPAITILYVIATFLFNLGQAIQANTDRLDQVDRRICQIEHALRVADGCPRP